jgi:preprotein translocase subunit Sec63
VESARELEIVRQATKIASLREHDRGWQFKALGLNPRTAEKSEVAKSYKNYMRMFHPDKLVNMTGKHREVL